MGRQYLCIGRSHRPLSKSFGKQKAVIALFFHFKWHCWNIARHFIINLLTLSLDNRHCCVFIMGRYSIFFYIIDKCPWRDTPDAKNGSAKNELLEISAKRWKHLLYYCLAHGTDGFCCACCLQFDAWVHTSNYALFLSENYRNFYKYRTSFDQRQIIVDSVHKARSVVCFSYMEFCLHSFEFRD